MFSRASPESISSQPDEPHQSPSTAEMKPNPHRATHLLTQLAHIQSSITTTAQHHSIQKPIRLVAVSKLKPLSDILPLAQPPEQSSPTQGTQEPQNPHLHFGENYFQELLEKSRLLPSSLQSRIKWHFIGGLQSNKARELARDVPGLWAVESVDSVKKANLLDKGRGEAIDQTSVEDTNNSAKEPLRVFVQVNTSGEASKSGVAPKSKELLDLCRHIRDSCPNLHLQGLMTIGAIARSQAAPTAAETENEDFACLRKTRDRVASELGVQETELELSMGMSQDFEAAIAMGSDEVRVGSTLFGERPPKKEAKVLETTD